MRYCADEPEDKTNRSPLSDQRIYSFLDGRSANNALEPGSDLPAFDQPLVGFAAGEDELFTFIKNDIGPEFYWTPAEAFTIAFPTETVRADELSVIAWVLPQTLHTRLAHRKSVRLPSPEWSKVRHYGEKVNENLRLHLVDLFLAAGYFGIRPSLASTMVQGSL